LACIQALNACAVGRDAARSLPEREKRSEEYARKAIALLQRAAAAGQFREPGHVAQMDRNGDLASLRDRDDYRRFRAALEPAKP
jgi:hypothetical protein